MYFKHKICVLWTHFFEFDFLSICISVYLGHPLSPTPTRAEGTFAYLKPLKTYLKPLRWPKRLTVAKAHVSYPHPAEVLSKFAL